ncbi:putative centrosomal protein [Apostichopus japonicus]|uniref:Putative centrosomal protein n=1 Tax=Stichopus japonicus TaxID=307972 RepID=A0A2G8JIJ3_STIJA|nr:putative centrosomal protein [Apostichopus japonicus]
MHPRRRVGEHSLDLLLMKLQEKDYEIFSLRNQLTQQSSSKDSEIDQLSRKLGQTEYETKKSQEKEKELQSSLKREIEKLSSQIKAKETTHEETKEKYKKMRDKYDKVKLKVQSLEHYLKDLPTADDYAKSSESISFSIQH